MCTLIVIQSAITSIGAGARYDGDPLELALRNRKQFLQISLQGLL